MSDNVRAGDKCVTLHTKYTLHKWVFSLFFPHLTLPLHKCLKGFILLNCGLKRANCTHPLWRLSAMEKKLKKTKNSQRTGERQR